MAEELILSKNTTREQTYKELIPQIKGILSGEPNLIANLANVAAMLHEALGMLWTGFYLTDSAEELVLGPFQGPLACTRISFGKGVCGTAAASQQTQVVSNVHIFPGHIACSALSNSEIVVPLVLHNKTQLVLDIDSERLDDFSPTDQQYLEEILAIIGDHQEWSE